MDAISLRRKKTPAEGWWLTALTTCLKPLSPSTFRKIGPRQRFHGCSVGKSGRHPPLKRHRLVRAIPLEIGAKVSAGAHDQADGDAGDHALSLDASRMRNGDIQIIWIVA